MNIDNIDFKWLSQWKDATKDAIITHHTMFNKCVLAIGVTFKDGRITCNGNCYDCKNCWNNLYNKLMEEKIHKVKNTIEINSKYLDTNNNKVNIDNIDLNWLNKWIKATRDAIITHHTMFNKCVLDIGVTFNEERRKCTSHNLYDCKRCWKHLYDALSNQTFMKVKCISNKNLSKDFKVGKIYIAARCSKYLSCTTPSIKNDCCHFYIQNQYGYKTCISSCNFKFI